MAIFLKALRELGFEQMGYYLWYQFLLHSGYLRWATSGIRLKHIPPEALSIRPLIQPPDPEELKRILGKEGITRLLSEADEVVNGRVRLFGGEAVPLRLSAPVPLLHWTRAEQKVREVDLDVKFLWEPARFGWALSLGRAYLVSGDERYVQAFWQYFQEFIEANPPYLGLHWASAQEVALRLIVFVLLAPLLAPSSYSTPERMARLAWAVAVHAARIPPTVAYARAQNNNHLLSEAAALYTAGLALPQHPKASAWKRLGWRWFIQGVQTQISSDGTYMQHSTNYQRLMLQLALWVQAITPKWRQVAPEITQQRLAMATHWLLTLVDPCSGGVPNLGPNDGAYILPLANCPYQDYRPVVQAAAMAFLEGKVLQDGAWDEMTLWLCQTSMDKGPERLMSKMYSAPPSLTSSAPHVLRLSQPPSWAYLRVARFTSRPGHADQLHLDLWWRGINLAQDAGTYLYNGAPPWDNALDRTEIHNTLTILGRDQMRRVGRFLWLDWAQAWLVAHEQASDGEWVRLIARHDGYRRLGLIHQRSVTSFKGGRWLVEDGVLPGSISDSKVQDNYPYGVTCNLHWLLPDWEWQLEVLPEGCEMWLFSPFGRVRLRITPGVGALLSNARVVRAGQMLFGSGEVSPIWGWVSPTYGQRQPALSLRLDAQGRPPFYISSEWILPSEIY